MLTYKGWANQRLFGVLEELPNSVLIAPQKIKFGSLIATLQHVYEMDIVWKAHLTSTQHDIDSRVPKRHQSISELKANQFNIDAWFEAFYAQHPSIESIIDFNFIDGGAGKMSVFEIALHVVNHGTYHRGHIAQMLYAAGVTPPVTDFPVFSLENQADNSAIRHKGCSDC
jgi:uncharacterized damage-inducible protein DinB